MAVLQQGGPDCAGQYWGAEPRARARSRLGQQLEGGGEVWWLTKLCKA